MKFDRRGGYRGSYDFGWDITPAVEIHGHDYSLLVKDNYYLGGGPFTLTRLDANLEVQWRFPNPNGVEWGINAPAVDRNDTVLAVSEDGHLYAIDRRGRERDRVFLGRARFAADTPVSIDHRGRVYAQHHGLLYVLTG